MRYRALLRRNSDGEERWTDWHDSAIGGDPDDTGTVEYIWTVGNYGCDCNRHLLFNRERLGDSELHKCGDEAYSLVRIESEDGRVLCYTPGRVDWGSNPDVPVSDVY